MVKQIDSIEEFDKAINDAPVVVIDFFATWCGPCIAIAPKLEDWERRLHATGQKVSFGKVDVDQLPQLARREGVTAMPTFLVYRQGKLVKTVVGANPPALQSAVEEHLSLVV